jgi:hypothetical protein
MPSASNAQWNVEAGQVFHDFEVLTDSGDHKIFTGTTGLWSSATDKGATILVNGVRNGFAVTPKAAMNDAVTVAAGQLNLNGVVTAVAGADVTTFLRPSGTAGMDSIKHSLIITSAGAISKQAGTEGATFSAVRGSAGGPPLIPVNAVEIGQVWLTATAAAPILVSEIFQVPGEHFERADTPLYTLNNYRGEVTFIGPLPLIHTGGVPKPTHARYYTPIYLEIANANTMQVPGITKTGNSTAVFKNAIGSVASALAGGSITVLPNDGVTDFIIVAAERGLLWQEFYPDANAPQKHVGQAHIGVTTTYTAENNHSTAVTLTAEQAWIRVE